MPPSSSHAALRVAIVGGGIGGLACALGLARQGVDVRLFESAAAFQEIGAGISFGLNAQHALEHLGLGQEFQSLATQIPSGQWFQWRLSSPPYALLGETRSPYGNTSCHRAEFLDRLAALLPEGVARFGHRLESVDLPDEEGRQRLYFKNGETYEAHVVIGADGIHSKTREILRSRKEVGEARLKWSGTWAYRGLIPTDKFKAAVGDEHGELFATIPQMFLARDHHLLLFPIAKGQTINVVGFSTDRSRWPSRPDFPVGDAWTQETSQEDMLADFPGWGSEVLEMLKCIEKPNKWALHQLSSLSSYTADGLVLLGDAAHGGVPHQGAMAGQALEDALFLSRLLSLPCVAPSNVVRVLDAVDAIRLPRANKVLETSLAAGDVYEYAGEGTGEDLEAIKKDVEGRMDWIWFHDHNAEFERARQWLRAEGIAA